MQRRGFPLSRVVFFGTDDFAVPILRSVVELLRPQVEQRLVVVSGSGRNTGRRRNDISKQTLASSVSREAQEHGIPVYQFPGKETLNTTASNVAPDWQALKKFTHGDLAIAASFGRFIPASILNQFTYGGINVHPSLLPQFRGPGPIYAAILRQVSKTGVSIQRIHPAEFDKGELLAQKAYVMNGTETYEQLCQTLAQIGAGLLSRVLRLGTYDKDNAPEGITSFLGKRVQVAESWAPKVDLKQAFVEWDSYTTAQVYAISRAFGFIKTCLPTGNSITLWGIQPVMVDETTCANVAPGTFMRCFNNEFWIKTIDGAVRINDSIQLAGRKRVSAGEWIATSFKGKGGLFVSPNKVQRF
ncbi:methionyl-tRNA formyltransferase Fmt1 [Schizosaccharomyces japonicus yFS275]|uniref:methionyl-tRNA formyltransferase n=1 Tax=Schizosaccharomyces japonicus (strain yFS275 / FY16936) TaxID=402676 RepID=B6K0H5_SCHJY|nr:methionyl-tRNA formyltransferase Fmt1 [Schizosaccharomyces japonicus yFS275]EEB06325.1 methionyl-tRNA formyltransferase Fmt1 [Schizosaccharomyces japonicus yFS275]